MSDQFVYSVRHETRFAYDKPVTESVMEVRLHPLSDATQQCHFFELIIEPQTTVWNYNDYLGNVIHHFNIPGKHTQLSVIAKSIVQIQVNTFVPEFLPASAWEKLDDLKNEYDFWEFLAPSAFTTPTKALLELAKLLNVTRRDDPLSLVREINNAFFHHFEYAPDTTRVDSLIDEALGVRKGVCQDFAHILIALMRHVGIPARYVSGYLFSNPLEKERSADGASHAWVEVWLPDLGWVGFDPTNNKLVCERHIKLAVGRDYKDVPPTRGVYKGQGKSQLDVSVQVAKTTVPLPEEMAPKLPSAPKPIQRSLREIHYQQQQQQQ